ncbi:MAG: phage protein GemA/Gp16 family protein [Rhizomicrobium sp.]
MTALANSTRNLKLGKLHKLAKEAGLGEDAYRDKLELVTGARSARDLSDADLDKAISSFHVKQNVNHPHTSKVKALWIACWNLGAVENGRDVALDAFVRRQTGKERLAFLTPGEANKVTEALKAIAERDGFVVPPNDAGGIFARRALLKAQWEKLAKLGAVKNAHHWALDGYVSHRFIPCHGSVINLNREQLDTAARVLGNWIRKTMKEQRVK